ncbi:MFS transporter [Bifidobacterium choloepi]|uniref:MFS transporter n=1 Tax=Bifidobacterium choloepi TaxID=2614131 RepID=A0A6I5NN38_9BIFI|nr:MFS transporter [Bifidobacterium choloepi]NEG70142.1 MFS transporter [Bifidobacterium choloepi]
MASLLLAVIYLAFISLGLPDSLLGSAWPTMSISLGAPLSWAGGISMTISAGTIVSALLSDRMTLRFGAGKVTACSVALTALALFGFSIAPNYWVLILLAIPYGLGAGGVDAALNNYVAVHYASRHMSWLHSMWGLGALVGPYIMSYAIGADQGWQWGYRYIGIIQIVLTAVIVFSLPLWKNRSAATIPASQTAAQPDMSDDAGVVARAGEATAAARANVADDAATAPYVTAGDTGADPSPANPAKPLGFRAVFRLPGAPEILLMFFCYCAVEQTTILWASTYMVHADGFDAATAAQYASLFFIGITVGRMLSGFLTMKFPDWTMIRIGQALLLVGVLIMVLPLPGTWNSLVAFVVLGFGCAPVYPCIIHSTPGYFGADKSQAIVGMQMAFAYVGTLAMPPLFGLIAQYVSVRLLPWYILLFTILMIAMHETLRRKRAAQ